MEAVAQPAQEAEPSGELGSETFPRTNQAPGDARRWARKLLGWLDDSALFSVEVLVSELVTNSYLHTKTAEIGVEVTHIKGILRVEVTDDGSGDWEEPTADREGGRGLDLVEKLSTRWDRHADCGTTVWFELETAG